MRSRSNRGRGWKQEEEGVHDVRSQQTHRSGGEGQTRPETLQTHKAGGHQDRGEVIIKVRSKEVVAGEGEKGTGNRLNSSQTEEDGGGI